MATTATASFSLTKIVSFPPSSPSRCSCSKILAVKEGRGGMAVKARFGSSKGGAGVLERPKFDQTQFDPSTQLQEGTFFFFQIFLLVIAVIRIENLGFCFEVNN